MALANYISVFWQPRSVFLNMHWHLHSPAPTSYLKFSSLSRNSQQLALLQGLTLCFTCSS